MRRTLQGAVELPTSRPRAVRAKRLVALVTLVALALGVGFVPGPNTHGTGFPLGGLRRLVDELRIAASLPVAGGLPAQSKGGKPVSPHQVSAATTSAHRGAGTAPGNGIGALPARVDPGQAGKRVAPAATTKHTPSDASFIPGRSTRIASAATATSDVYANPDGSYTRKVYEKPVNLRSGDGTWTPIDPTLQRDSDGRLRQKAGAVPVDLAPDAADPSLATVRMDVSHSLSYSLAGAAHVTPRVDGATALFPGVLDGVDLRFETEATNTKESLVLHSAAAPTSYRFPLRLQGLTARLAADGSVSLLDAAGKVRGTIPAGSMTDSKFDRRSGSFTRSNGVRYTLSDGPAGQTLTVAIDSGWLHDPTRVFPVTVDPTVAFDGNGDTYAYTNNSGDNSGSDELLAGTWDSGTSKAFSFIRYGAFGSTFAGAKLSAVSLKIFAYWAATCTFEPFSVNPVRQSWTPQTVTSYPGPTWGSSIGLATGSVTHACANTGGSRTVGDWMTVPLNFTEIQNWALGGTNYGLAITASQTSTLQWKRFVSANGPANFNPYLNVTYAGGVSPQVDAQYPTNGYAATTLTPELLVAAHDPDNFPKPLTYDFAVYDSTGAKIKESGWIASKSWVVPDGTLAWGKTYNWTVIANDGYSQSASQTINQLTTPVPQPLITSNLAQNGGQGFDPGVANYTTSATDATVGTVGPALAVTRSYNSEDPRVGLAFGSGWASIVDTKATEQKDSGGTLRTVLVNYPNGQEVVFGRNADGSYAPPMGRYASFGAITGGYRLTDKDGTVYTFTAATGVTGQYGLASIADAQGRTERFGYDTSNRLATMTAASGRALHLTWTTPAGATTAHVATVSTDADASTPVETWLYTYTGDQLASVCPPTSTTACATYGYGTSTQYPAALLDAGPQSYWRLGESTGTQAVSAVTDNYGTDNATYRSVTLGQAGPLAGSTATATAFNGTTSAVQLPAKLVSTGSYLTVALWFKAAAGDSGPLFSYQADPISSATTAGNYVPALYIGTSGRLYGQLWNGVAGAPIVSGTVTDGQWHHVVLSGAGSQQWMYLDGAVVGSLAGTIQTVNSYSVANEYFGAGFWGGGWPDEPHYSSTPGNSTGYPAYFKGSISDAAYFDRTLTANEVATIYHTAKVASHPLQTVKRASGNPTATVSYDAATGSLTQVTDANGGVWKLGAPKVSGSSQVYASTVLGAAPTDYWRLGETGTTDAINQVNGSTATYDSVKQGVGGPFSDAKAAEFDGTASNIRLPAGYVPSSGPLSVSLWFKTITANRPLLSYQTDPITAASTSANYVPALYIGASGKLVGEFWQASSAFTSAAAVTDGTWHHVVLAASTTSQAMYLDGALVGTKTTTWTAAGMNNVYLGAGFLGGNWPDQTVSPVGSPALPTYYRGQIAEVAFYRGQLTAAQVAAQYTARDATNGTPAKTVTITDPTNKTLTHVYDVDSGQELSETDSLGHRTQYGYDTGGFLRTVTDPNGNITTTEHDVRGNTVSSTTCQDQSANKCSTVYYTYFPDATTKVLAPDPRNDLMLTMRDGRSSSASDNTYLTSYTYDAAGNRTAATDPLGRVTKTAYTDGTTVAAYDGGFAPAGLPMKLTTAGGAVQSVVYDKSGDVATVTDPVGKVTLYTYDVLGRVKAKKETTDSFPAGLTTSYEYDKLDRLVKQTDPPTTDRVSGAVHTQVTTKVFDVDGLVKSTTLSDATGGDASRTEAMTYNAHGQQDTVTDANLQKTTYTYDLYGNEISELGADGTEVDSSYDTEGDLLTTTLVGYTGDPNNPSPATNLVVDDRGYDPGGRLATETDAMGWVTTYTYTDNGLDAVTTRKDPSSATTFVNEDDRYDAAGNLTEKITDNGAAKTDFVVDAAGRPTSSTFDPATLKRTSTYTYNTDDQLVNETLTDPSGTVASSDNTYDLMGRVTSETEHTGPASTDTLVRTSYKLDQYGLVTTMTDPDGAATDYEYDEAGQLAVTKGPAVLAETNGGAPVSTRPVTLDGFDTFGEQVEERDPNGNTVLTGYDAEGNVLTSRLPSYTAPGTTTAVAPVTINGYDKLGQLTSTTDPLNHVTSYTYDQLGRMAKVTQPNGGVETYTYDLNGDELSDTDPNGAKTAATYDFLGRPVTSTEVDRQAAASFTTIYGYGVNGKLASVQSPGGAKTTTLYNAAGEPTTETDAALDPTTYTYNGAGLPIRTTASDGTYTAKGYDMAGRQTNEKSYDSTGTLLRTTSSSYDAAGNVLSSTDAMNTTSTFTYDATGLLTSENQPISASDSITTSFGYDAAGNRTRFTDGRGHPFLTTYNAWDLPESRVEPATTAYPNAADRTFTVGYNANGDPSRATMPGGVSITYGYDAIGDLTSQAGTGAEVATTNRTFGYDLAGRLTSATAQDGQDLFTYDDRDDLLTTSGPAGASSFSYTPDRQMKTRTDAAGTTTYGYDSADRLRTIANPTANLQATLGYDSLSQLKSILYGTTGDTRYFGYDSLHRLTSDELKTSANASVAKIAYGYDLNDNMKSKTTTGFAGSTSNTYGYDLANRLTSWTAGSTSTVYAYDKSGNRTQAGSRTFAYDERNQLLSSNDGSRYTYSPRGALKTTVAPSGESLATQTDAFGQTLSQAAPGGTKETYTYDGLGRMLRPGFSYTGTGNDLASDGTTAYTRDPDGDLLAEVTGTGTTAIKRMAWTDQHDDVVGQFDPSGTALAASTTYDPLGKVLNNAGMIGNLGYQSVWTDNLTGRVDMLARWYNTDTGQFDSRDSTDVDPEPDSVSADRFAYADDNPLNETDPTGAFGFHVPKFIKKAAHAVTHYVAHKVTQAVRVVKKVAKKIKAAVKKIVHKVRQIARRVVSAVRHVYHAVKRYVRTKVSQGRKWAATRAASLRRKARQAYQRAKQAGKAIAARAAQVARKAAARVRDAAAAALKSVKDHKNALIEIAAIGVGIVGAIACTTATAGAGAVACMVGAATLINVAKDAAEGNIHNVGDLAQSVGTGVLEGGINSVTDGLGGKVAGGLISKLGPYATSFVGRTLAGAAAGTLSEGARELATTRHLDARNVLVSAGISAAFSGRMAGGTRLEGGPEPVGISCRLHSFAPDTPVLMANGTTRPIKDVNVGDRVLSTDPKTENTTAGRVELLHLNQDTEFADITVERGGQVATLHTTVHHPFWDEAARQWRDAADLRPGQSTLVDPTGRTMRVVGVHTFDGVAGMRDLTIANIHTYYVLAGATPVLVHNCDVESSIEDVVDHVRSTGNNHKVVVIGRTMDRVHAAVDTLRQQGIDARAYRPWVNDPFDAPLAMRRNKRWIADYKRAGSEIIDIGPDTARADPFGEFYGMEVAATKDYPTHKLQWPPSGG